ncbi:hypothetical protein [Amedibacillus sp. YH-ame10]
MNDKISSETKKWINNINNKAGIITLITSFLISVTIFLFNLISNRYELGYSAFFGLKKTIRIEYDFVGMFFTFIIVLLFFVSVFLALEPKIQDKRESSETNYKKTFCTQSMLLMLILSVFYLFVLTRVTLTDKDIFRCIFLPAIPLLILFFLQHYFEREGYSLIITIILLAITIFVVSWAIYEDINWKESFILVLEIMMVSSYFTAVRWIYDKLNIFTDKVICFFGKSMENTKEENDLEKKDKKWKPIYLLSVIIVIIIIPIAILLILFTSLGWSSAERTREIYMTKHEEKEYILFEQEDYYIALPIEEMPKCSTENKTVMRSIENEYVYLNKESILTKAIKLDKIERSENNDFLIIEYSKDN